MNKIGIFYSDFSQVKETVKEVCQFSKKRGFEVIQAEELSKLNEVSDLVVLSLGGDGTFLKASQIALKLDAPVLGVNLGNLGFLTDVEGIDVFSAIEALEGGSYFQEERTTLKLEYLSEDKEGEYFAINDFVVSRSLESKILQCEVTYNELLAGKFRADGFVVSSPTGSTAYSLSLGGPIVTPRSDVFMLTFIAPHKLSARPVVFAAREKITIKVMSKGDFSLQRDGVTVEKLEVYDRLSFMLNSKILKVLHIKQKNFFEVLNKKFGWGA